VRYASYGDEADRLQRVLWNSRGGKTGVEWIPEIQVEELKRRLDAKEDLFVLDVREPHEYQICNNRRTSDSAERFAQAGQ